METVMEKKDEMESITEIPVDKYYDYEELCSRPYITPNSQIPENLLQLRHSFGYDSELRGNLQLLDDSTLMFIAGNLLVLLDLSTRKQRYLRSCRGGGIGSVAVHPTKKYFAVAEKGNHPDIIVYEYPSLRPYRILRDGTEKAYSSVDFNTNGSLLAGVGNAPDYMLTLWNWRQEQVTLRAKAVSQEAFKVRFSLHYPELLTSSGFGHVKFWEMAYTCTGPKLLGDIGRFGVTDPTDIEGFIDLPNAQVVSGSSWGNLLLWRNTVIRMEITRTDGQSCHDGTVQPFFLEEGQIMTFGSDGMIRVWDFDSIDYTIGASKYELDPRNEKLVGRNVCICSMVRSSHPESTMWFAQDSCGAIWKVDLSFTHKSPDPERLFSFHAGAIQGLDVSKTSYLMATTAPDRSVKVFDFLSNREVTDIHFNQGGTVINWAPPLVNQTGGLLVAGFEDGVVRLLELYDPQKLKLGSGYVHKGGAKLRLKQALKPHSGPVTAIEYKHDGVILATGSSDGTVFFFNIGDAYVPIGFIHVPGPVQALEWSPFSGSEDKLLIMCRSGHVVEVQIGDLQAHCSANTFQLRGLPSRSFRFRSIKSQIRAKEEEIARRQALQEAMEEEEEEEEEIDEKEEEEEEEEEELPPIYIPDPPSPLCLGFYSHPDHFWLSVGGFDSGFLYHCKFSENQDEDPNQRQDEPFHFLPVHNADEDPILSITFSSDRQLMFCGMHSGAIRVYPLHPADHSLTSMQAYWTLNIHDNHCGHLHHIRCSHDNKFVLTAGDDGNIFSFSTVPQEELEQDQMMAKIPSPRVIPEDEQPPNDIEDPAANTIEMYKHEMDELKLQQEIQLRNTTKSRKLAGLRKEFSKLVEENEKLPEHVRLKPSELLLDQYFSDQAEKVKAQKVMEVRKQLRWEEERCNIGLSKLQDYFRDIFGSKVLSVVAIATDHKLSTYRMSPILREFSPSKLYVDKPAAGAAAPQKIASPKPVEPCTSTSGDETMVLYSRPERIDQQSEKFRKAAEKADRHRAAIEKRKKEWAQLYTDKPEEDCEDPKDVQAIQEAKRNIGDLKLRSDKNFAVPKHLRMNTETTMAKLKILEEKIHGRQTKMNERILALRDAKVCLVSQLLDQGEQLQEIQTGLSPHLHRPPPALPTILPEETQEKKVQHSDDALERYRALREQSCTPSLTKEQEEETTSKWELSDREKEILWHLEVTRLYKQDRLLDQMESSICQFDAELRLLHHEKLKLDWELKLAELQWLTIFQELPIHEEFREREKSLEEKLNRLKEVSKTHRVDRCYKDLELRQAEVAQLQVKKTDLLAAFQYLLGEQNKFKKFLTKVFNMKAENVNKRTEMRDEDEEDEEELSDHNSDSDEEAVDYKVCPPGCDPGLFRDTLRLREHRLQLEERLEKEEENLEILKRDYNHLLEKESVMWANQEALERGIDSIFREKQLKLNALEVVVPLRLNQIKLLSDGSVPSDMTNALVVDRKELTRLQDRIKHFGVEKSQQRELYCQARKEHAKLTYDIKIMNTKIEELERKCHQSMMSKFGRVVDLEDLLTIKKSTLVDELEQKERQQEFNQYRKLDQLKKEEEKARTSLMVAIRESSILLQRLTKLFNEKRELQAEIEKKIKKMGRAPGHNTPVDVEDMEIQTFRLTDIAECEPSK
ncbi:cilia- and flagella-associated protein 44-like [Antennarius striatus]|uniref:cilia- and flagella-associated protein 44-like n=1 Tax=Antennarius striatus TaxID=241820 RepID=UPI0035B1C0CA